ncbi:HAD family hydrolase [Microbacterium horticulturae]|uniref:HAD family hydrolase n=1 Tax=Microbacterium horticulturae TaxID=3028316 RepID=A0ABY8BUS2_9MICO|nr:HAD family hydrolase [Microbacterium sp. KACC 23027]WEG07572.1 HAD family hydrolase [Microbacterium sp. KACC 23027]
MSGAITAVCFDLDGTLLRDDNADRVVRAVAYELGERCGIDADVLAAANQRAWNDYWPEAGSAWLRGDLPADAVPREVWRRALATVGVDDPTATEAAVRLHVQLESSAHELYPEAAEVLTALRSRGILTAIITNGPSAVQRAKLERVGLDGFEAVIVSGEVGMEKPDAGIFRTALDRLGVDAAATVHVGDNQSADVAGASSAGLTAVWINRTGAEKMSDPDHAITDLRGLLAIVG